MPSVTPSNRILLRPANTSRVSFWWQLGLGLVWLGYVLFARWADVGEHSFHFVHWVFLAFTIGYLAYVLVNNAPLLGTQSYLEFTPGYLVFKSGLFRAKQVLPAEQMAAIELEPMLLRVRQRNGEVFPFKLSQVKGKRRKVRFREQLRQFAAQHGVVLQEHNSAVV